MRHVDIEMLIPCPVCDAVNIDSGSVNYCRRCGQRIYHHSITLVQKSWAYLITAIIAYIPANLYPMMILSQFGHENGSTIFEGILELWYHGDLPIAIIILFASILVPVGKFMILAYLLLTSQNPQWSRRFDRHRIYHFTEMIGPWSMVDVFVVGILAGLVHFSGVRIIAGTASTAFALSVFFTLLAAHAFDAKLIRGE